MFSGESDLNTNIVFLDKFQKLIAQNSNIYLPLDPTMTLVPWLSSTASYAHLDKNTKSVFRKCSEYFSALCTFSGESDLNTSDYDSHTNQ